MSYWGVSKELIRLGDQELGSTVASVGEDEVWDEVGKEKGQGWGEAGGDTVGFLISGMYIHPIAIPASKQILSSCFPPVPISNPLLGGLYSEDDNL